MIYHSIKHFASFSQLNSLICTCDKLYYCDTTVCQSAKSGLHGFLTVV